MPSQSLTEITAALENAIKIANQKKTAAEAARKNIADTEKAYNDAVSHVKALSDEYNTLLAQTMNSYGLNPIQTTFGQVHK